MNSAQQNSSISALAGMSHESTQMQSEVARCHRSNATQITPCAMSPRQRYDVDLVTTSFHMPLWEALALVRSSDVVLGMHGAGLTNLLAIHKVGLHAAAAQNGHLMSMFNTRLGTI